MTKNSQQFIGLLKHPLKFRVFLFMNLPAAYIAGVRLRQVDEQHCVVSIPYKWLNQNPFKSIYFACQAMAAEMSTGALAMLHLYKRQPPVSMLVTKMESVFTKKATERIWFTCNDGNAILQTIENAIETGEGQSVTVTSTGANKDGEVVSEFKIEWSFKVRVRR